MSYDIFGSSHVRAKLKLRQAIIWPSGVWQCQISVRLSCASCVLETKPIANPCLVPGNQGGWVGLSINFGARSSCCLRDQASPLSKKPAQKMFEAIVLRRRSSCPSVTFALQNNGKSQQMISSARQRGHARFEVIAAERSAITWQLAQGRSTTSQVLGKEEKL